MFSARIDLEPAEMVELVIFSGTRVTDVSTNCTGSRFTGATTICTGTCSVLTVVLAAEVELSIAVDVPGELLIEVPGEMIEEVVILSGTMVICVRDSLTGSSVSLVGIISTGNCSVFTVVLAAEVELSIAVELMVEVLSFEEVPVELRVELSSLEEVPLEL